MRKYEAALHALQQRHDKSLEAFRSQIRLHSKAIRVSKTSNASLLILEHACKQLKRQVSVHARTKERMIEEQRKQVASRKEDLHRDMGAFRKQLIDDLVRCVRVCVYVYVCHSLLQNHGDSQLFLSLPSAPRTSRSRL
jgi:hypothetical protein